MPRAPFLWGLLAPTPLGFNPLLKRLTPDGNCHDKWTLYAYGFTTTVTNRQEKSQRRVDNTHMEDILRNQVAQFSMHIWLIFR